MGKKKGLSIFDLGANISNLNGEQLAKAVQTGIMPIYVDPPQQQNMYGGIDTGDGVSGVAGVRLEMASPEFTTKMNELATFGTISKKRYFEIKKLYSSKDVESANMASRILTGLHDKMLKE